MKEIWKLIERYSKLYVIVVSAIITILIINETLSFAERIINNIMLGLFSLDNN